MKTALVLGGGGIKGAFQAGVLSVLLGEESYIPDGIFGSSTGALNGAFLVSRAGRQFRTDGRVHWPDVGQEITNFWTANVTQSADLWKERDFDTLEHALESLALVLEGKGFLDSEPLRNLITRELKSVDLLAAIQSGIEFSPGTVDLFSGRIEYPDASEAALPDFILASAALPIIMPYVDIEWASKKGRFVDGGFRDVAPLQRAINKGYRKITCIVCQAENVGVNLAVDNVISEAYRLYEIVLNEIISNDLNVIQTMKALRQRVQTAVQDFEGVEQSLRVVNTYADAEVEIIRPDVAIEKNDSKFTTDDIKSMINLGIDTARSGHFKRV